MVVQRGEVWWANLPEPSGSEPGFRRPVVIVQSDTFNRTKLNTVVVAAIYSNLALAERDGNVLIAARESGLDRNSVINSTQLATVDVRILSERTGILDSDVMERVDEGLRLVLSL